MDHCPECGSYHIDGGSMEINGDCASQLVRCDKCGACFMDLYRYESSYVYVHGNKWDGRKDDEEV